MKKIKLDKRLNLKSASNSNAILFNLERLLFAHYAATFKLVGNLLLVQINPQDYYCIFVTKGTNESINPPNEVVYNEKDIKEILEAYEFVSELKTLFEDYYDVAIAPNQRGLILDLKDKIFIIYVRKIDAEKYQILKSLEKKSNNRPLSSQKA